MNNEPAVAKKPRSVWSEFGIMTDEHKRRISEGTAAVWAQRRARREALRAEEAKKSKGGAKA